MPTPFTEHAYSGVDDLTAMQAALASWIQQAGDCGYCHVGDVPHRLYNGLRGRYPLAQMAHLWRLDDEVVAFAACYPRDEGFDAFVSPNQRGGDLERTVLNWAFATCRDWMNREDMADNPVMSDVSSGDEIRAALLIELGFAAEDEPWLNVNERSLLDELPAVDLPEGFTARPATGIEDAAQLAAVHSGAFGSGWTPEVYRDEVMLKPGYAANDELVIIAPDGRFAAFTVTWRDTVNRIGLFEPVGVHEDFQRRGLGRALMAYGLHTLRARGMHTAQVCNERSEAAPAALYRSSGFLPKYEITGYGRQS